MFPGSSLSFLVTFSVFVGVRDVHGTRPAHGLRVDALSDVGGVHGVRSHVSIFVLLVEDHVAVDLQQTRDRQRAEFVLANAGPLTSANTKPVSKGWET